MTLSISPFSCSLIIIFCRSLMKFSWHILQSHKNSNTQKENFINSTLCVQLSTLSLIKSHTIHNAHTFTFVNSTIEKKKSKTLFLRYIFCLLFEVFQVHRFDHHMTNGGHSHKPSHGIHGSIIEEWSWIWSSRGHQLH
jgi:hypothetical protein